MIKKINEQGHGKGGPHVVTLSDISSKQAKLLEFMIEEARKLGDNERVRELIDRLNGKYLIQRKFVDNILPTAGRSVVSQRVAGINTFTLNVNDGAIGTSSSTPVNGDTQLGAESYRKAVASKTAANNISYITSFYASTDCNGTYSECGLFIDGNGTGNPNTGQILSHALIGVTKTPIQSLTIDYVLTWS